MALVKDSDFRNKVLMPILFDNATRNVAAADSPRKRIGHEVVERKRKLLSSQMKNLYKRRDDSKQQWLTKPNNPTAKSSKSLSAAKLPPDQSSSTLFLATPTKCRQPHPQHSDGRLYRTNIQRLQLVNQIQSRRMAATSASFRVRQQPSVNVHRTNNAYELELDFEKDVPMLSQLKWLIEAEQYNADRMDDIRKKIEQKNLKVRTLAELEKDLRNVEIETYIQSIDVEGVDNKQIQQREELNERFKGIPGFLEELARKEQLRDEKFRSPVKRAAGSDNRLATSRQANSPFVTGLLQQTSEYERWKSPLNRNIEDNIRILEQTLQPGGPTQVPHSKIMLQYLKQSRLEKLPQN